jgi:hypothetical protein
MDKISVQIIKNKELAMWDDDANMMDPLKFLEKIMPILFWANLLAVLFLSYNMVDHRYGWSFSDLLQFVLFSVIGSLIHLFSWSITMLFIGIARDLKPDKEKVSSQGEKL